MLQGIGLIIVTLGIIGFIWGIFQKLKAGRVADAPLATTGDVVQKGRAAAGPKGQISAQGNVVCHQPLYAPFSGVPCLFYSLKCTAEWKEGDVEKKKVLDEQKVAAQFALDDGTGPVWIDAHEGGDFEPTTTKRETKGTGLLGGITGTELVFGNYKVQTGMLSLGTKYTVEEEVMPMTPRLYACGKLADQGGMIASPNWRQLILSAKSRDELLSSATKGAKIFLIAGAASFLVGSGMCVVGQLFFSDDGDSKTPATASTAAPSVSAATTTAAAQLSATTPPPSATETSTAPTAAAGKKGGPAAAAAGKKDAGAPAAKTTATATTTASAPKTK
jgi:hypothetical protein